MYRCNVISTLKADILGTLAKELHGFQHTRNKPALGLTPKRVKASTKFDALKPYSGVFKNTPE